MYLVDILSRNICKFIILCSENYVFMAQFYVKQCLLYDLRYEFRIYHRCRVFFYFEFGILSVLNIKIQQ